MTGEATSAPIVALLGMPGIGKTSVAAAYAWNFGAAYAAGAVCWISLRGAGPSAQEVLTRYQSEVRTTAEILGLDVVGRSGPGVLGLVADHLHGRQGPSLWVVDDVPDGLDPDVVRSLIMPAGIQVRTVLISRTDRHESTAQPVVLGPMAEPDAQELLRRFRKPAPDEQVAFEHVVNRLGGHPLAVQLAGSELQDRQGLVSFKQFEDRLVAEPDTTLAAVADLLRDQIVELAQAPRLILQLALAGDPAAALPVRLVAAVVSRVLPVAGGPEVTGDALAGFAVRALATPIGTEWQLHSLVLDAARRHLTPAVSGPELARAAAEAVEELATDPDLSPADRSNLVRHAAGLAAQPDLPPATAETLLRRVVTYYEDRGEPILAAPGRDRMADLHPDDASVLATAAAIWNAAGEYRTAENRARDALVLAARAGDRSASHRARRTLAEALDEQSRYDEAENHWKFLDPVSPVGPVDTLATRVARLRGLRLRGRLTEVKELAARLLEDIADASDPAVQDLGQAAAVELARAELLRHGQRRARELTEDVVEHYRRRGLPEHARALEAQEVLAEAWLTLHLWELWPDAKDWVRAEGELRALRERYRRSHAANNQLTLAASVALAHALVSQGKRREGDEELDLLQPKLDSRLGDRHPLSLRALFLRGLIRAQLQQHTLATPLLERALHGQRAVLGQGHAHTLRTQYELAVMYKLAGDRRWHALMKEVNRLAPAAVGRENDLYVQSAIALVLLHLPAAVVDAVARFGRPKG